MAHLSPQNAKYRSMNIKPFDEIKNYHEGILSERSPEVKTSREEKAELEYRGPRETSVEETPTELIVDSENMKLRVNLFFFVLLLSKQT